MRSCFAPQTLSDKLIRNFNSYKSRSSTIEIASSAYKNFSYALVMPQLEEKSAEKCDSDVSQSVSVQNDENNATNTLKRVKRRLKNFTIRRKAKIDDENEMNQRQENDEPSGKSKITLRKIFRKSSFKKFMNNIQNFTNFTVSFDVQLSFIT
jgi:hypothetical protein